MRFAGKTRRPRRLSIHAARKCDNRAERAAVAYHTAVRFMIGDYEGCVAAADFAGDLNPNVPGFKSAALWHLGREEQAAAELDRFFTVVRDRWCVQEPATPAAMSRWFLQLFPIANLRAGHACATESRAPAPRSTACSIISGESSPRHCTHPQFEWNSRRYERHAGLIAAF